MKIHPEHTNRSRQPSSTRSVAQHTEGTGGTSTIPDNRRQNPAQAKLLNTPQLKPSGTSFQAQQGTSQAHTPLPIQGKSLARLDTAHKPAVAQRLRDTDFSEIDNLTDLNKALFKLTPEITGVSLSMFETPGANPAMLDQAIADSNLNLYDGIKRKDILDDIKPLLADLVDAHPVTFAYDTHGNKHFPGGPPGTKFTAGQGVVNPQLEAMIGPLRGRIRRDARGKDQNYYLTSEGIEECDGKDLTIQVDYTYATDTITYHGYPDDNVAAYSLSRTKGGADI